MTDSWQPADFEPVPAPPLRRNPSRPSLSSGRRLPFGKFGDREPVRFPVWVATVVGVVVGFVIDLLLDVGWKQALVGGLIPLQASLLGTEVARGRAWSPLSVLNAAARARREGEAAGAQATAGLPYDQWGPPDA